ncbi:PASTA domain-containing protein [Actinotalea sp. Marseille-Q4924]|uniref:PASTA domain-containing protein n=1 Tax=Actinotalea sp. Marseille-Q4924 TaxID=2866571 RepID=UPI002104D642|nr:PASTA domain-containing protein [Actinotalea sp. Marseille-Q4924]
MPDLVGQNLQYAQDTLQSLGSYVIDQEDASGLDRMQVNDSNWVVCSHEPVAGTVVPVEAQVTVWAVKIGETCP